MRYYSDKLGGKIFDTEEELFKAEKAADKSKEGIRQERKKLIDEIERCEKTAEDAKSALREANNKLMVARNKLRSFDTKHQITIVTKTLSDYDSVFDAISDMAKHF